MSLERARFPKSEEEPKVNAIKSISPHFKYSSCRAYNGQTHLNLRELVSEKKVLHGGTFSSFHAIGDAGLKSGCSLAKRFAEAQTQAASFQSHSQNVVAFNKNKPLKISVVGMLPEDDELFEVNSKTSLCDSFDGEVDELPVTLPLKSKIAGKRKPDYSVLDKSGQSPGQTKNSNDHVSKRVPIKVMPRPKGDTLLGLEKDLWTRSKAIKSSQIPIININSNFKSENALSMNKAAKVPASLASTLGRVPSERYQEETTKALPSMSPLLISSCSTQRAVQQESSPQRSALDSPSARPILKTRISEPGSRLLEMVDPNDGFDLDILSMVELQASCSPKRSDAKKVSRMFNFDDCSFVAPRATITRRSFDCGPNQEINNDQHLHLPQRIRVSKKEDFFQRSQAKRGTHSPKRLTDKPLLINFDRLKEISKVIKQPGNKELRQDNPLNNDRGFAVLDDL